MKYTTLFLSLIISFSLAQASDLQEIVLQLPQDNITTRNTTESINLFYDREGFAVKEGDILSRVNPYDTEAVLRDMDAETAVKMLSLSKLKVSRLSNGEYTVERAGEIKGGGPIGATIGVAVGVSIPYIAQYAVIAGASAAGAVIGGPGGAIIAGGSANGLTAVPTAAAAKTSGLYWGITLGTLIPF